MPASSTIAADLVAKLSDVRTDADLAAVRKRVAADEEAFGVRMRDVFAIAKAARDVPLSVVHELLDHPAFEPRLAAMCILDFKARTRLTDDQRRELCDLYLARHDRITTWDMVDRTAPRVLGTYLVGRDKTVLYELAGHEDALRRRSAITAPLGFLSRGSDDDLGTGFDLAARLATDPDPIVNKPVGIFLKHAGERDRVRLLSFLDEHSPVLARPAVRLAVEKLPPATRDRFRR